MPKIAGNVKIRVVAVNKDNAKRLQKDQAQAQHTAYGQDPLFLYQGECGKIQWNQKADGIVYNINYANRGCTAFGQKLQGSVGKYQNKNGKDQPAFVETPGQQHAAAENSPGIDVNDCGKGLRRNPCINKDRCCQKRQATRHKKRDECPHKYRPQLLINIKYQTRNFES